MAAEEVKFVFSMDDQFSKQAAQAEGAASKLQNALGAVGKVAAAAFSINAIKNFGASVIDSLKNYEYFHASLGTLLQGNVLATQALEKELVNLAKTTPFELTEVQNATKQLLAYGFKAGDVVQTMRTLGDVSSGVGAPLGDIAYLYGTLKTSGRVMLMDLRQFAGRGIPIYESLAKVLHVNKNEINGMVSAGKIGFRDIEKAFKQMTSAGGNFYGLMDQQSKTVGGQLSNLGDSWEQLKVSIGKSQHGILADTLNWASNMINAINKSMVREDQILTNIEKNKGKKTAYLGGSEEFQDEIERLADMVDASVGKAGKSKEDAIFQKNFLSKLSAVKNENFLKEIKDKNVTDLNMLVNYYGEQQKVRASVIKGGMDRIKGLQALSKMKSNGKEDDVGLKKEADSTKSQKYTNITINIKDITGIGTLINKSEKEAGVISGEEITKYLVKGITDAQILAGQ